MRCRPLLIAPALVLAAACATTRPAPAPAAAPAATPPAPVREPPPNWQLLDEATDHVPGISLLRAERELLAGKTPRRTVVVAVIDGGIDTAHAALRASLWTNSREIRGNGRDDDANGYTDDVYGWDFLGGRDGRSVRYDNLEVARLYALCTRGARPAGDAPIGDDGATCARVVEDFRARRARMERLLGRVRAIADTLRDAVQVLRQALGAHSVTPARVVALRSPRPEVQEARRQYLAFAARELTPVEVDRVEKRVKSYLEYGLNPAFDPRAIVGDNYADATERHYGNADVVGNDPSHGTAVSGVIAAARGADTLPRGVAPAARVMMVLTVPDGDERDKDVANAIRYAVDNGAHVITMSFGKAYSPQKRVVDEAVRYADARGVLMIHAAGNEAEGADGMPSFPTPHYVGGGRAQHWIEVGASSWRGADGLAAPFSNYGRTRVDVFAPGVDLLAPSPGGGAERSSGTSLAAPVVAGLAAVIMAYYPQLSAAEVRRIILDSATRRGQQLVIRPGSDNGERVPFAELSATGGIVNAYAALRLAEQMTAAKP